MVWDLSKLLVNRLAFSLVGIGIVLVGLPYYFYWTRRTSSSRA